MWVWGVRSLRIGKEDLAPLSVSHSLVKMPGAGRGAQLALAGLAFLEQSILLNRVPSASFGTAVELACGVEQRFSLAH